MSVVRELRRRTGVTQEGLATRAGTSQSAIASYEAGKKSPTLTTVDRLGAAVGLEVVWKLVPPLTRSDRRSIALHQAIAEAVYRDPNPRLAQARRCLRMMRRRQPGAKGFFDEWARWLQFPLEQLIDCMLDPGMRARDMRQVTPFAGVLSASERTLVYLRFRRDERRNEAK